MRVVVIGAGAAGLCALRNLTQQPRVQAVAFEQTKQLGGTWVYTDQIDKDELYLPVHASMYANLRTNLPKEIMAFTDYPFPSGGSSFLGHVDVHNYLKSYCQHFGLEKFIKFSTCVETLEPVTENDRTVWKMVSRDVVSGEKENHEFDAVLVCNGHHSVPLIPKLKGLDRFKGEIIHSHNYRHPHDYSDKRVVLLGAAASGTDIGIDLSTCAKEIVICHKKPPMKTTLPGNVRQAAGIREFTETDVVLDNEEILHNVDTMMFCTGYHYSFPFLSPSCHPGIVDERIPLYKHIISPQYPTLSFIGIPKQSLPFPQFDLQIKFVISCLNGNSSLPSEAEMMDDIEKEFNERLLSGKPIRYAHRMEKEQWAYNADLATLGKSSNLPLVSQKIYEHVTELRHTTLTTYKKHRFSITSPETFDII